VRGGRVRGFVGGTIVEADNPWRSFMLSLVPCRAFVSRTSGEGIDGREGSVRPRDVEVVRALLRSRGDEGVWERFSCESRIVAGGVSSGSERRTHDVGDKKPTAFSSRAPGVTVAVDEVREDMASCVLARERDAVRARMVEDEREEEVEVAEAGAGGGTRGRVAKPEGAFLTIFPILSSVVLIRACRSWRSLKPLRPACDEGGRLAALAPVPEPKTRRVVDMPRGLVLLLRLRLAVVRDRAGIPEVEGDGATPLTVRLTVGEVRAVGVDVLRGTRRGD